MNRFFSMTYFIGIYVFLYLPIFVMIVYSFNHATFSAVWNGFTLDWYRQLFQDSGLLRITGNSLLLAVLAASLATTMGMLGAVALFRYQFLGKSLLQGLIFILIVVPELVFGISLLVLFSLTKLPFGFWTLLVAHITFCLPFVIVTIYGRLRDMDENIFEAARDLGANDQVIFWRIMVPLMLPAIIAGWLLSFTLSMDDMIISFFVSGPSFQILPLYIYSKIHTGITPELNALCTLIFGLTLVFVVISHYLLRRKI